MATPTQTAAPAQTASPQAGAPQQGAHSPAGQGMQGAQGQGNGLTATITVTTTTRPNTAHDQTINLSSASRVAPGQENAQSPDQQQKQQQPEKDAPSKSGGFLKMLKGVAEIAMEVTGISAIVGVIKSVGKMFQGATEMATAQGQGNQASQGNHRGAPQQGQQRGQEQAAGSSMALTGQRRGDEQAAGRGGSAPEPQQRAASSLTGAALAGVRAAAGELVNAGMSGAQQGRAAPSTARAPEAQSQGQAR